MQRDHINRWSVAVTPVYLSLFVELIVLILTRNGSKENAVIENVIRAPDGSDATVLIYFEKTKNSSTSMGPMV